MPFVSLDGVGVEAMERRGTAICGQRDIHLAGQTQGVLVAC